MSKIFLALLLLGMNFYSVFPSINFRSSTSGFIIPDGTNLYLQNKIQHCNGKIVIGSSSVSGQTIGFTGGTLQVDDSNPFRVIGTYHTGSTNKIVLSGNQTFQGNSSISTQDIQVSGNNNRISGDLVLGNDIVLQDINASLTCALVRSLSQNIQMNSGTLFLEENLKFVDGKMILGNGTVRCNKRKVILGSQEMTWNGSIYFDNGNDFELNAGLHLAQTWTFSGSNNTIIGNGSVLSLEDHGNIVVERGASLVLKNILIKNVSNGNIRCLDDSGKITFQDVTLVLDDTFSFSKGSFDVLGYLDLSGSNTFVLQPTQPCTIKAASVLSVEPRMTLSVDFITTRTDMLLFEDSSSLLSLRNCTLYVTTTGLLLKGGALSIKGLVNAYVELKQDELFLSSLPLGITIGDNSVSNDCIIEIQNGSQLFIQNGWFIYKNIDPSSWKMYNDFSILKIGPQSILDLQQPISYDQGTVRIAQSASLYQRGSNYLDGSAEFYVS